MIFAAGVAAVFMYHHVSTHVAAGPFARALTVTPQEFEGQLRYLHDRGCAAVSVGRLVDDVKSDRVRGCEVALTFDDGYADALTDAAPLLRRFGDVATFFVTTGYLGDGEHVRHAEVRALALEGMEIGAHTVSHEDLTRMGVRHMRAEIAESRKTLQALSGQPVDTFAYPGGRYDPQVESEVRRAGFRVALSTDAGYLTAEALTRDMYALPRFRVLRGRGAALLRKVLAPTAAAAAPAEAAIANIARARIAGNAPDVAERVAVALLNGGFPEPILKVRVLSTAPATVAGIMLSGVKFHERVNRVTLLADASDMVDRAFAADASVTEVDVWAVVPIAVRASAIVSGEYAVPTNRTVFSASALRRDWVRERSELGSVYFETGWLQDQT